MARIQWSTLICDVDATGMSTGRISMHRVRKLSAIVMAWLGVGLLLFGVSQDWPLDGLALVCGVLIVPMTGGQISDAIFNTRLSRKIEAGEAVGRRAGDRPSGGVP